MLQEEWDKVTMEELRACVSEMPARCRSLVKIGGGPLRAICGSEMRKCRHFDPFSGIFGYLGWPVSDRNLWCSTHHAIYKFAVCKVVRITGAFLL